MGDDLLLLGGKMTRRLELGDIERTDGHRTIVDNLLGSVEVQVDNLSRKMAYLRIDQSQTRQRGCNGQRLVTYVAAIETVCKFMDGTFRPGASSQHPQIGKAYVAGLAGTSKIDGKDSDRIPLFFPVCRGQIDKGNLTG
ncbi:MAG: hypothetical protein A2Y76_04440 [Planctomycetes bacterium RBG_13_60_9]|nr:MAG: hypothetical protein A2Y76_04440 [Planctomycetes bacterium RBG_13_60_9]